MVIVFAPEHVLDFQSRIGHIVQTQARLLAQTSNQKPANRLRYVRWKLAPVWILHDDGGDDLRDVVALEGPRAREHLVEHEPNAQMSAALVRSLPLACSGLM